MCWLCPGKHSHAGSPDPGGLELPGKMGGRPRWEWGVRGRTADLRRAGNGGGKWHRWAALEGGGDKTLHLPITSQWNRKCGKKSRALGMCEGHRLLLLFAPFFWVSDVLGRCPTIVTTHTVVAASCVANSGSIPSALGPPPSLTPRPALWPSSPSPCLTSALSGPLAPVL